MAWNYRKRITIAPGVRLNVSKKGVSTTFGVRGASINVGKNGTYLNTGIPGTGIYNRQKIGGGSSNSHNLQSNKPNKGCGVTTVIFMIVGLFLIFSQDFESPGLLFLGCAVSGIILDIIINLIINRNKNRKPKKVEQSIESQIETAKNALNQSNSQIQKEIIQNFISCAELSRRASETDAIIEALKQKIEKKNSSKLEEQLKKYETELLKITTKLNEVQLDVDKDLDDVEKSKYSALCEDFEKILSCKKIWQITHSTLNTELKSAATTAIKRQEVNFDAGVFNYIKSSFDIPMLRDLSDNIYYIYPRYIIKAQSFINFEVFPIDTINFKYSKKRFIEDGVLPEDAFAVDYTYQYVNKNGEPDRRFAYNPRLPIAEYGEIEIENFGLTYQISNYLAALEFATSYNICQIKLPNNNIDKQHQSNITENFKTKILDVNNLDSMFDEVARYVVAMQFASPSNIQRKFSVGFLRAARLIDQLEAAGIVGAPDGSKPRQVLIPTEYDLEKILTVKANELKFNTLLNDFLNDNEQTIKNKEKQVYHKLKSDYQTELQSLIGLSSVKAEVETLANFIKIQQERQSKGLKISQPSYHCVFTGNPGTGKTTVARIVADIYKSLGILSKGHLVETDRSGLVAEYVGQTAVKTNKIIDTALDGVLFIDEAYSLISDSGSDYGKEAIATLLKRMEDNRDQLIVILAGYTREMQQFIDSNPGLQSRFNRYIEFPDYSDEELYQIFEMNLKQFDYTIAKDAIIPLQEHLKKTVANKDKNFGNARFVRNLFEKTIERQANRLSKEVDLTNDKLSEICFDDIPI